MKDTLQSRRKISLYLLVLCLTGSACSRNSGSDGPRRDQSWQEYVPVESDLVIAADLDELRRSEWYSESAIESRNDDLSAKADFSYNDIRTFVLASDLDALPSLESLKSVVKLNESGQPDTSALGQANLQGMNATILLSLTKSITWQQAESAVDVFFASVTNATISRAENERAITITQSSSPVPLRITLSESGRMLEMTTGLSTDSAGNKSQLNQLLARDNGIAARGPLRVVMQASRQMREKLQRAGETASAQTEPQDSTAMLVGTALKPFVSFEGMALALTPTETATEVYGEMEFGSEEHALEAEVAINNILIPLITLTMTQRSDGPIMEPILQKTKTYVRGGKLELKAILTPPPSAEETTGTSAD